MTYRKKLIEVALPIAAMNDASAREKSLRHGHPSTLHLWWSRKPLATARAVVFASLVDDPDDSEASTEFAEACRNLPRGRNAAHSDTPRQRLFDFIERLVQWESTTDEQVMNSAGELIQLSTAGNPPPLFDPFAGGGTIPLEAQRLGLEAHAGDLNPVAVLLNKALIEIPPRFADMPPVNRSDQSGTAVGGGWRGVAGLVADVSHYAEWIRDRAWERIGHLYPIGPNSETVIAWIWARTVKSPNPAVDVHVPLTNKFVLSKKKGRMAWVEPRFNPQTKRLSFVVRQGKGEAPSGTVDRGGGRCIVSDSPIPFEYIRAEGQAGRMGRRLMAIATKGPGGRNYYAPSREHEDIAEVPIPDDAPITLLPEQALGFRVQRYGMKKHRDLFTPRQLVAMTTFSDLVKEARSRIQADAVAVGLPDDNVPLHSGGTGARAYAEAVTVYLAFAVDKAADFWSSLSTWLNQPKNELVSNLFSRQAISMVWDFAEANPFSNSGGNWIGSLKYISKVLNRIASSNRTGYAMQVDATSLSPAGRFIISTDPPYYDNIGYGDLSDYYYIWLRRSLRDVYPNLFSTVLVPKEAELIAASYRFDGDSDAAKVHFETGLQKAFSSMRQIVHPGFPLTVYYAFKQSEAVIDEESGNAKSVSSTGWETMLEGLIQAGFTITGTWPMRTERIGRMREIGSNALASSILLVCRPRPDDSPMISRREFVNTLRRELPAALREMQSGNIAPVDLAQASIGPGMAVYSRYSKVLEPNGDHLTVRTALQIINRELDAYLAEQEGYIDEDSRFAVAWFEQFGFKEGSFGQADVLARAKNTSVDGLAYAGVLRSGAGKVQLHHWSELDAGWDPATDKRLTVWEAVHHLIERLNVHGEEGAAMLLAKMPSDLAAQARQLAYRLYSICDRKGWAEHARDYNALVISWSASQEQAREYREQHQQGKLF